VAKKYTPKQFAETLRYELPKIPSQASLFVANEIEKQIQKDFDAGVSPYGRQWKPLAEATIAKGRQHPPLTDTHKGRSKVRANSSKSAGVAITSTVRYMGIHQAGTRKIPKRPFLPTASQGLPKRWAALYEAEVARWTRRV
jgi:phage gpG-like protein